MNPLFPAALPLAAAFQITGSDKSFLCIGIGCYVLVMLGIGFLASGKIKTPEDYLVAGRRLPLWMATATLLATWFGAGSSLGTGGMATKLHAAEICLGAGCDMVITNGKRPDDLYAILEGRSIGTTFSRG